MFRHCPCPVAEWLERRAERHIYMPPWIGFETRHGLMPKKCLNLYPIEDDGSWCNNVVISAL